MSYKKHIPRSLSSRPFEQLKKLIQKENLTLAKKHPVNQEQDTLSDEELFSEAMRKVKEIKEFRDIPVDRKREKPVKKKADTSQEVVSMLKDIAEGQQPINLPDTQEYVEWVNPLFKGDIPGKLHCGHFSVQDYLDLHGFTVAEAEVEVKRFIHDSLKRGRTCVKIIHGRGLRSPNGPVLKDSLITWLSSKHRKRIVAFVTARQCDGGLGAVYVLLKKG